MNDKYSLPNDFENEIEAYIEWDDRFFKTIRGAIKEIEEEKKKEKKCLGMPQLL